MNKEVIAIPAALLMVLSTQSQAQITPASSTFDAAGSGTTGWTYGFTGAGGGNVNNPTVANDFDKFDFLNTAANAQDGDGIVGNLLGDTEAQFGPTHGGDAGLGDGGLRITRVQDTIAGNEWAQFSAVGTMALGEQYTFAGWLYNNSASFYSASLGLYNASGGLLATTGSFNVSGNGAAGYVPIFSSVSYTATLADVGLGLELRLIEENLITGGGKNPVMDNFSLTVVVPEPTSMALAAMGGLGLLFLRFRR